MTGDEHHAWARARTARALGDDPGERLVGMMVASVDWRAAVQGRSGGLSSDADKALLRAWRAAAGLVLVGARTLEQERYGWANARRDTAPGAPPRIITISRDLSIDLDAALSHDADLPLTVYTEAEATDDRVEVVRLPRTTAPAVLADARERYGAPVVVCEGGPTLLAQCVAAGALTDLALTVSPVLVGEGPPLLEAFALDEPRRLDLVASDVHEGHVFLHYRTA